jgi:hypothetical protein
LKKTFEAFAAFLETLSVAMTAANSINSVVNFFRCIYYKEKFVFFLFVVLNLELYFIYFLLSFLWPNPAAIDVLPPVTVFIYENLAISGLFEK